MSPEHSQVDRIYLRIGKQLSYDKHVQALQAVHGAVHQSDVGVKYSWLGAGYISNMYYKWIANHATYDFEHGGDLSMDAFTANANIEMVAYGDSEGNPRKQTGKSDFTEK